MNVIVRLIDVYTKLKQLNLPVVTVSIHHIHPSFYFGYVEKGVDGLLKIASSEKALLDIFYLSQTKTRLFKTLRKWSCLKTLKYQLQIE